MDEPEEGIHWVINGQLYKQPQGGPAPYLNNQNRTMVPLSLFLKAMDLKDYSIQWDEPSQTAKILYASHSLELTHGTHAINIDGNTVKLDSTIEIIHGRLFAPVRTLAEALGGFIQWEPFRNINCVRDDRALRCRGSLPLPSKEDH